MSGQSKRMSLLESCFGVAVGFIVALMTQLWVFPLFGIHTTTGENISIAGIFTVVSIIRGYCLRRFFNWIHVRAHG